MTLRTRLRCLSTCTKVVCVVIVVASVGGGIVVGIVSYSAMVEPLEYAERSPVSTSPDGKWQMRVMWDYVSVDTYAAGDALIEAWPVGRRDESRVVYFGCKADDVEWEEPHLLKFLGSYYGDWHADFAGLDYGGSSMQGYKVDVATSRQVLDGDPVFPGERPLRMGSLGLAVLAGWIAAALPGVAVVLIVAVKGGKPAGEG